MPWCSRWFWRLLNSACRCWACARTIRLSWLSQARLPWRNWDSQGSPLQRWWLVICTRTFPSPMFFENSHSAKPLIYKITGVWGNHEGSMLLWVLILALFGALVALFGRNLPLRLKAAVLSVQAFIAVAFDLFILITSNPFLRIVDAPLEGRISIPSSRIPVWRFIRHCSTPAMSASPFPSHLPLQP